MKDNKKYIKFIVIISIILICVILSLFSKNETPTNKLPTNTQEKPLYENISIDRSKLNILYLNVGQADSTLIVLGEAVMLIDAGDPSDGYYISKFLKAQGIEKIDYLIETHEDEDHSGEINKIVNDFNISNIYMPKSAINKSNISNPERIKIFEDLENVYKFDKATWKVLNVDNSEEVKEDDINNTSIVIQLEYGNTKYLFMGDCEESVEKQLLQQEKLEKIDVLKVGHHGSNGSSSEEFLEKIHPQYSIISVNNAEYKKHPDARTLNRLEKIQSTIYRTDINGTVWITSDGTKANLEINCLDININGANRVISFVESKKYALYFTIFPSSSTTV